MFKTRLWFCTPFFIGGICEVLGYIFRAAAWNATGSLIFYIMQAVFLLIPPVFFAATLYMVYSRLVRALKGEEFSLISPRWTTIIFVIGDLATLNVQSSGAGMLADDERAATGNKIVVAGLILQVLLFIGFMICCLVFHLRYKAHLTDNYVVSDVPWKSCLHMLYWTSMMVLVRNVFRVIEYIMDKKGYLQQHEWPTFTFDSVLMLLVMAAFYIWYPSNLQPKSRESMVELMSNEGGNPTEH
ncbi:hypothetical protein N0V84_006399 [Fusarium piperis]|uniref:Uncharacterized protein n=1 Tax=Fusarium piperis TaxID=1435070 RepID=A0A9W9BNA4_9HYPO|nr:hypothetical protein N0V84_006399 [Fusarium piperis]